MRAGYARGARCCERRRSGKAVRSDEVTTALRGESVVVRNDPGTGGAFRDQQDE